MRIERKNKMVLKLTIVLILVGALQVSSLAVQRIDSKPLGMIGSGLHLVDEKRTICLELSRELQTNWPISNALYNWNKNGKNLFTTELFLKKNECDGTVLVTQAYSENWWGSTEFYARGLINVQLSSSAPTNHYNAIVCHEFGHVLGLPHSTGDGSCMDHNQNNPEPTALDLSTVSQESWSASTAQYRMLGEPKIK